MEIDHYRSNISGGDRLYDWRNTREGFTLSHTHTHSHNILVGDPVLLARVLFYVNGINGLAVS